MNKVLDWIGKIFAWILMVIGEVWLWIGDMTQWLLGRSIYIDLGIKILTFLILLAYSLKLYIGIRLPIFGRLFEKCGNGIKKFFGIKDSKFKTIQIAETDGESIEEVVKHSKTITLLLVKIIKKGYRLNKRIMKKVFSVVKDGLYWIFVANKWTNLALLSMIVAFVGTYLKFKGHPYIASIDNEEFWGAIATLVTYAMSRICSIGWERISTFKERWKDKNAYKENEKIKKEELKNIVQHNILIQRLIRQPLAEINKVVVKGLVERLETAKVYGVMPVYENLLKGYKSKIELGLEYLHTLLGEEAYNALLDELDKIAEKLELYKVEKDAQGNEVFVNLIIEEMKNAK